MNIKHRINKLLETMPKNKEEKAKVIFYDPESTDKDIFSKEYRAETVFFIPDDKRNEK